MIIEGLIFIVIFSLGVAFGAAFALIGVKYEIIDLDQREGE